MAAQVQSWAGADAMTWANAIEWSAGNVLLTYALPDQRGTGAALALRTGARIVRLADRKSTRLNSSHLVISYAVFCLKKQDFMTCFEKSDVIHVVYLYPAGVEPCPGVTSESLV